ncbi:hypothetical protein CEUSTIGMA_g11147.t1 [Chlamydomonas eustigma]|uniref:Uncharacterized protein n=1 Tax=Chlamydomonas eustigma TaxID=1157962 RepID=A0A250XLF7_9CHLO|nr:hypothetical protein CEUSTIGMA_g11147.t1 [Chlamydomonas eustigma]|eukprot:GAX83722.1 hypothetical protein CEUSTIGMA_g11147.t1 [Chlamydomonas eustigma]
MCSYCEAYLTFIKSWFILWDDSAEQSGHSPRAGSALLKNEHAHQLLHPAHTFPPSHQQIVKERHTLTANESPEQAGRQSHSASSSQIMNAPVCIELEEKMPNALHGVGHIDEAGSFVRKFL